MNLPELTYDLLERGISFPAIQVQVDQDLLSGYAEALGGASQVEPGQVPPGVAGVIARRSYLSEHVMPPGGVLLRQDVSWLRAACLSVPLEVQGSVLRLETRRSRRLAVFGTDVRQGGEPVLRVETTVSWP